MPTAEFNLMFPREKESTPTGYIGLSIVTLNLSKWCVTKNKSYV